MSVFVQAINDFIGSCDNKNLGYVIVALFGLFLIKETFTLLGTVLSVISGNR